LIGNQLQKFFNRLGLLSCHANIISGIPCSDHNPCRRALERSGAYVEI